MKSDGCILAHDLGTSGNKAVLYGLDGVVRADAFTPYETSYPAPGFVEQSPQDWWDAVRLSTRQLISRSGVNPREVIAICFSGQMMGCLPVDGEGEPLRPSLIWADLRGTAEAARLADAAGTDRVYEITGHRVSASYSAAKLMWIKANEPEVYSRTSKMLQAKDYIVMKLTGVTLTDYSDACGTNLFDLRERKWCREIIDACGLSADMMPEAVPSTTIAGGLLEGPAGELELPAGIPVVIGGGDGVCATTGAGVVSSGRAYNVLGTSSWIATASREPVYDPQQRTFNWIHLDEHLYNPCGTMQGAGYSYSWFKDALCTSESDAAAAAGTNVYEILNEYVKEVPAGAEGLLFMPYLMGERSPWWNPDARGAFIGLGATHGRREMARAVLEGVAFNLRIILEVFSARDPIERLTVIGGGARNPIWMQILADVWNRPLDLSALPEDATSLGAAICGGVGVGAYSGFEVAEKLAAVQSSVTANPGHAARYDALYEVFLRTYKALEPTYSALAAFRGG